MTQTDLNADMIAVVNELVAEITILAHDRLKTYGYTNDDQAAPILSTTFVWLLINVMNSAEPTMPGFSRYARTQVWQKLKENTK